jgi:ABC-type transporter Mla subunit MlaD
MPHQRGLYLRVGGLVLAGLVLAVGFILFFTANRFGGKPVVFETYIRESVQGLDVGSQVRFRGVPIGRVSEIRLASAEYPRPKDSAFAAAFQLVVVRFSVDTEKLGMTPSVADAVELGLRARMAAQGITGTSYIELDFVSPQRFPGREVPWRPTYPYVPAIPSTVAQVQSAAEQFIQQLQEADLPALIANFSGLILDLRNEVEGGDVSRILQETVALLRSLRQVVEGADAPALVSELRATAAEARELLASREVRSTLTNASQAAAELRAAAARLPASLASIEQGVRAARGATTDVQAELAPILRDLRAAVGNLRDITETLRRYPSQAIFGAPPPQDGRR